MQGIMVKMLFTELIRSVYNNYEIKTGELYSIIDEYDQPVASIHLLADVNHYESLGIED